jgi:peptidoglycan hydrolase-like amidase
VALAAALVWAAPAGVSPVQAYPGPSVQIVGHGFGHGRGMGQYGAYGDALAGWSYTRILDTYYGGTTMGSANPATSISVRLGEFDGAPGTIVQENNHDLVVSWDGHSLPGVAAVYVSRVASGLKIQTSTADCGGPWSSPVAVALGDVSISPAVPGSNDTNEMVQACPSVGPQVPYRQWLRGRLVVKAAVAQTWNVLPLDSYVQGVVPRESPSSWGNTGGEAALQAQAVAARSYAVAFGTPICDSTSCQVYGGRAMIASDGTTYVDLEGTGPYVSTSDAAVAATSGQVRLLANGSVASTEYSASTGGYTAGGVFPAVPDPGDATPSNPFHTWTQNVPVATVEAAFPSVGSLLSMPIIRRNGLGDMGGRVLTMQVRGTLGTVTISGAQLEAALGLPSDWFSIVNQASGGVNGYWLTAGDGGVFTFGGAVFHGSAGGLHLNQPVVGMAAAPDAAGYWLVAADGGVFTYGVPFYGSTGSLRLNKPVIGMAAASGSDGYWLFASDGGVFTFGPGARFFGSTGGLRLNKPAVGMAATPSGDGYWLVASDGGVFSFGDAGFYGSTGSYRLNQPVVAMAPTATGHGYWLLARDGGVFSFGDAPFLGSVPGLGVNTTIVDGKATADGRGYLLVSAGGTVYSFGDAPAFGGMPDIAPGYTGRILGIATQTGS